MPIIFFTEFEPMGCKSSGLIISPATPLQVFYSTAAIEKTILYVESAKTLYLLTLQYILWLLLPVCLLAMEPVFTTKIL